MTPMLKELVVNSAPHETRVALLENGTIVEVFIEREDETSIAGNIYKGRVQRVLPGMQAAFVDIGFDMAAFIYVDDVLDTASHKMYQKFEQDTDVDAEGDMEDSDREATEMDKTHDSWKASLTTECSIEDLLTEGQEILVQVAKSSIGTKGPRVTTHISLAGRYLVLMPTVDHIGISKRIEDEEERTRLKEMLLSIRENKFGYIFRTQAQGIDQETIKKEMDFLNNTWDDIMAIGVAKAVIDKGLHIPQDISLVGYNDILISRYFNPPLTTVRQQLTLMGETAVDLLIRKLTDKQNKDVEHIELSLELIKRSTA